jgi:RimJ/RimL family protein N-acetyltransferase
MVQWAGPAFPWPLTQKHFREHIQASKEPNPSLYPIILINREQAIGYYELSRHCRNSNQAMLSRVIITPKNRSRGMASFMIDEALHFVFMTLNLNRIGLGVFDFNKSAIHCYTKAGFKLEGTLRESAKVGNSYWNCHLMSILRKEWKC